MTGRIRHYTQDKAGFSFAELMVVIALISALSAIALPSLLSGLSEKRLKNAARNLYSDLQRARLQAVKENKKIVVKFINNTDNKKDFYYFDMNSNDTWDANEFKRNLTESEKIGYGLGTAPADSCFWNDLNACGVPTSDIYFKETGVLTDKSNGMPKVVSIFITDQSANISYAAIVTGFGSVRLRRFDGSAWEK